MANSPSSEKLQSHKPNNNNSPTALTGMEQTFPTAIASRKKASQSPNHYKPLPPTPSLGRRISLSPQRRAYRREEVGPRRSSSIYSRTPSAWYSAERAPEVPSVTDFPLPKINSIYRDSILTPSATMSEPQLLLPRTYSPLLSTPSSANTPEASPAPPIEQRPSALLPPPVSRPQLPQNQLHTVSLEKAQAEKHAPGNEHLLPEELRARTIAKARSSEHIMKLSDQMREKPQKPGSAFKVDDPTILRLPSMMMFDAKTWHKFDPSLHKTTETPAQTTEVNAKQLSPRWSGSTAIPMSRDQSQTGSDVPVDEPERGRTMHRLPRKVVRPPVAQPPSTAVDYTSLFTGPWDQFETSRSCSRDHETAAKLKPQPLFAFNSPGDSPELAQNGFTSSVSPKGMPITSHEDWDTDDSNSGTPPPPKFFRPEPDDEEDEHSGTHSRTGSIPISPPSRNPPAPPGSFQSRPVQAAGQQASQEHAQRKKQYRESAYYPYVGRRRYGKSKNNATHNKGSVRAQPSLAMHAARTAAMNTSSPEAQAPSSKKLADVTDLLTRATNKAVKIADKLTRTAANDAPSPGSPATIGQSVTAVYLGWSDKSKDDFDATKPVSPKFHYAAGKYGARPEIKPTYTHVVTPARPLDERAVGLASSETQRPSHSRKGSILGGLLELSREKGREKRREEIKKTIKLIPNVPAASSVERPTLEAKSASDAVVPRPSEDITPARGIWGRRFSEFGLI